MPKLLNDAKESIKVSKTSLNKKIEAWMDNHRDEFLRKTKEAVLKLVETEKETAVQRPLHLQQAQL